MCCITCGEFIYKGKKFNAKKETAVGEEYYGIKVFRFYIKCTRCSAEITFKTDPKNADYIAEHGATRNYEPTTAAASAMPNAAADDSDNQDSEEEDPMKALEASQAAAKKQMEDEDTLADLRQRNARIQRNEVDAEAILAAQHDAESKAQAEARRRQQEEEDEIVRQHFYKVKAPTTAAAAVPAKSSSASVGGLGGGYGSDSDDEGEQQEGDKEEGDGASITVKRKPPPSSTSGSGGGGAEPTVADLLASRGIALNHGSASSAGKIGSAPSSAATTIKRKSLASSLGIKVAKKKKA